MVELHCSFLRHAESIFASSTKQFESIAAPLGQRRANWSPDRKTWSVAACIDHLATTSETYFVHLEPALKVARATGRIDVAPLMEAQAAGGGPDVTAGDASEGIVGVIGGAETTPEAAFRSYGKGTWVGRLLLGALDPARPKFKAVQSPKVFRPQVGEIEFGPLCTRFREAQMKWHEILRLADGLELGEVKLATPVSSLLRMTAAQAIQLHVFHEPRHLAQAERLTRHPDFPD